MWGVENMQLYARIFVGLMRNERQEELDRFKKMYDDGLFDSSLAQGLI